MKMWGKVTLIDLRSCNPKTIRNQSKICEIIIELCELIKMKRFGEFNIVKFGDDDKVAGFSFTQLIETSLVSGHLVDQTNNAFIDIFSCKDYDSTEAANFLQKEFEAEHVFYQKINRYY